MGGRRWWVLSALIVALLPFAVDVALVLPALPHLPGTRRQQPLLAAAFPLGLALALPLTVKVFDVRRQLLLGLTLSLVGSVVEAAADTAATLLVGRLVVAVGAAAALPAALRAVQAAFDPAEHVRAVAIWAGFTGLALAAAPLVGGALVDGRSGVFAVQVPFLAIGLLTVAAILPSLDAGAPHRRAAPGLAATAAVFAVVATAAALSYRLQPDWSATGVGALIAVPGTALSIAARAVRPGPTTAAAGLALVAGAAAGIAVTGSAGLVLLVFLGIGAALAMGGAPVGGPLPRLVAVGLGLAAAALSPTYALLAAAGVSVLAVGADLLRRRGSRGRELTPA